MSSNYNIVIVIISVLIIIIIFVIAPIATLWKKQYYIHVDFICCFITHLYLSFPNKYENKKSQRKVVKDNQFSFGTYHITIQFPV